ncbi:MAG: carboxymuconolactone decarboxylase family protein [Microthrixaceae bacterium]
MDLATALSGHTAETIAIMAHNPALVEPFLGWAMALHTNGVLSPRLHEVVALRVACNCGSTYEWNEHVRWAHQAGLTDAEIASIAEGEKQWSGAEGLVITAVDELHPHILTDTGYATEVVHAASPVGHYDRPDSGS